MDLKKFLHTNCLKVKMPSGEEKEFKSDLPKNLKEILKNLRSYEH